MSQKNVQHNYVVTDYMRFKAGSSSFNSFKYFTYKTKEVVII